MEAQAARALDLANEGPPTVKWEPLVSGDAALEALKAEVIVPRLFCLYHGLWEGKEFSLAQYL